MKKNKMKESGEVFTPKEIVDYMLNMLPNQSDLWQKQVMDNSCGDGAILVYILRKFLLSYAISRPYDEAELTSILENNIHGIDINPENVEKCKNRLDNIVYMFHNTIKPKWDIRCANALEIHDYDGKMDYVIGNPPYVRVHNIKGNDALYETLKSYEFCKNGPTDLYLAFYELGINMLNKTGKLIYISPTGWLRGIAGSELRKQLETNRNLESVHDFNGYCPFEKISASVAIFSIDSPQNPENEKRRIIKYFDAEERFLHGVDKGRILPYEQCFVDGEIFFGDYNETETLKNVKYFNGEKIVKVKNGLATLLDDFFITQIQYEWQVCVPIVKASTGKEAGYCLLPNYVSSGKAIPLDEIKKYDENAYNSILLNEQRLRARNYDGEWWSLGRAQGIKDIPKNKIAISNMLKDENSIKITEAPPFTAVYSGFYITYNGQIHNPNDWYVLYYNIISILRSPEFFNYVKLLGKQKRGGYYAFSAKDAEKYLNWKLVCYNKPS